jgi:trk system potassium uptake protein TrkH
MSPRYGSPDWRWDLPVGRSPTIWQRLTPAQLFVGSFVLLILLGTIGLKTLPGLYTHEPLSWIDALFTSTSAVCVTGLIVVDTATVFTFWGQLYILVLIQLGGLGMLTFTSLVFVALGGRLSLRQEALYGGPMDVAHRIAPGRLILDIVRFTFAIEAAGIVALYALWAPHMGWEEAIWPAVFHSISAFCNAGFSTYSDSLMQFQTAPVTLVVISALVTAGGLGFLTMEELYLRGRAGQTGRVFRLSLHTRLVVVTSIVVLLGGWVLLAWLDWNAGLAGLAPADKISNAFFMSAATRTAGFNAVDYSRVSEAGNFLTILLMAIGGSPGSTAGGIKTTTFALLVLLAWSRYRGDEVVNVWGRSLRKEQTDRAVGLFVVSFGLMTAGILALTVTEQYTSGGTFMTRMFEAVSAFCTVGISLGETPRLSLAGRVVVIVLMFLGRVGPLVLAAALATRAQVAARFRYAYEDVAVG